MTSEGRTYIAIDLKSFYASVECVERGLDPLTANLVVADASRTEKTICLAVSPSLKAHGIPGRARLFEVVQRMGEVNAERLSRAPGRQFSGASIFAPELEAHPELKADYVTAVPRMAYYIEYSARVYNVYLRFIAPEDIHVYSIDEVFMDVTGYLSLYRMTPRELAAAMIREVLKETGITATAGIGSNLYLCKVAMDVVAKHTQPDPDGVRIAQLDEESYRRLLWDHRPLTDFWRVGRGIAGRLERFGMYTMGDVAVCSVQDEELLYRLFGVNAELLIDHAWGWEPCTISQIKSYTPRSSSFCSGQVLQQASSFQTARLIAHEMADAAALALVEKRMVTDQLVLTVGYDRESLADPSVREKYRGEVMDDGYGREVPKYAHGTANLDRPTSSARLISKAVLELYDRNVNPDLLVRRLTITTNRVVQESEVQTKETSCEQLDLFTDYGALEQETRRERETLNRERKMQEAVLRIQKKYGKNAILKGMNLQEGATARTRNAQIGGHRA